MKWRLSREPSILYSTGQRIAQNSHLLWEDQFAREGTDLQKGKAEEGVHGIYHLSHAGRPYDSQIWRECREQGEHFSSSSASFFFLFVERLLFSFRRSFCLSFVVHLSLDLNGREMQGLGVIVLQRKAQPG